MMRAVNSTRICANNGVPLSDIHPFSAHGVANQAHLRLLATTDLHANILAYDYYADRPSAGLGLAQAAPLITRLRDQAANALLFDNGDFLQGNPLADYVAFGRGPSPGGTHPVVAAMNTLGYDAGTLGNHDFNFGLEFLDRALAGANFPVVSANVATQQGQTARDDRTYLPPYVLLDRVLIDGTGRSHTICIGVIGFVPPQIMTWDHRHLEGRVTARDILAAARDYVPQMKDQGADIIIALSHSGIGDDAEDRLLENASTPLAGIDGIDAVVAGHSHLVFPGDHHRGLAGVDAEAGTLMGKPAVMASFGGTRVGVIDLMLNRADDTWRIKAFQSAAHRTATAKVGRPLADAGSAEAKAEAAVLRAVHSDHQATLSYIRRPIGHTDVALVSYFAFVGIDAGLRVVAEAQRREVKRLLQDTAHADLPLLSSVAPFRSGGRGGPGAYTDIPAGEIALRNVADLYIYGDDLRAVRVTGVELRGWLERSASIFAHITQGQENQPLMNPRIPGYLFDVIYGVEYTIDATQPPRFDANGRDVCPETRRIASVRWRGRQVLDDDEFLVATNSYRAGGSGNFPGAGADNVVLSATEAHRQVISQYIRDESPLAPDPFGPWDFVRLPGTRAYFDTGPGAGQYLDQVKNSRVRPVGSSTLGFDRYLIDFEKKLPPRKGCEGNAGGPQR